MSEEIYTDENMARNRLNKWYTPLKDLLVKNFNELTENSSPYDISVLKNDLGEVLDKAKYERDNYFKNVRSIFYDSEADGKKLIDKLIEMGNVLEQWYALSSRLRMFQDQFKRTGYTVENIEVEIPKREETDTETNRDLGFKVVNTEYIDEDIKANIADAAPHLRGTAKDWVKKIGLIVHTVEEGGPAENAGVKVGDFIVKINDQLYVNKNTSRRLAYAVITRRKELESYNSNDSVKITLLRVIEEGGGGGGKRKKRTIKRKMHHKKTHKKKSKKQNKRSKTYRKRNNKKTHRKY